MSVKMLQPPLVWSQGTKAVEEDHRYQRWTKMQVRAMKNGTYDWKNHVETPIGGTNRA